MALISPALPTIGQPNSTEDQDVVNALSAIVSAINGGLDTANLSTAAAGITAAQFATAVQAAAGLNGASTRRGKCIVPTEEPRTNTAYGLMTTPDRVSNIVLPTDGLIFVAYNATWKETVAQQARAAIFVGATQLKVGSEGGAVPQEAIPTGNLTVGVERQLVSAPFGLVGGPSGTAYSDVTTGQAVAAADNDTSGVNMNHVINGALVTLSNFTAVGGPCVIFAAAGTYDISVQFKAISGTVTAKNRKLWVWSMGFD